MQRAWCSQVVAGVLAPARREPVMAQRLARSSMPPVHSCGAFDAKVPGLLGYAADESRVVLGYGLNYPWHVCRSVDDDLRRPSDFELDLGKVADTLSRDYPAFFDSKPEYGIYHEDIKFCLGADIKSSLGADQAPDGRNVITGKRAYMNSMEALRKIARTTVSDGKVTYRLGKAEQYGHHLRVNWECRGHMLKAVPFHITAISLYSIAATKINQSEPGGLLLTHKVHRHVISVTEVNPPSLRRALLGWLPQRQPEPALACEASLQGLS